MTPRRARPSPPTSDISSGSVALPPAKMHDDVRNPPDEDRLSDFCSDSDDASVGSSDEDDGDSERSDEETYLDFEEDSVWLDTEWEGVRVTRAEVELTYNSDDDSVASAGDYGNPEVFADYYAWNDWGEEADRYLDELDAMEENGDSESESSGVLSDGGAASDDGEEKVQNLEALRRAHQTKAMTDLTDSFADPAADPFADPFAIDESFDASDPSASNASFFKGDLSMPDTNDDRARGVSSAEKRARGRADSDDDDFDLEDQLHRSGLGSSTAGRSIDAGDAEELTTLQLSPPPARDLSSFDSDGPLQRAPSFPETPLTPVGRAPSFPETPSTPVGRAPSLHATPATPSSQASTPATAQRFSMAEVATVMLGQKRIDDGRQVLPPRQLSDLQSVSLENTVKPTPRRSGAGFKQPPTALEIPELPASPAVSPHPSLDSPSARSLSGSRSSPLVMRPLSSDDGTMRDMRGTASNGPTTDASVGTRASGCLVRNSSSFSTMETLQFASLSLSSGRPRSSARQKGCQRCGVTRQRLDDVVAELGKTQCSTAIAAALAAGDPHPDHAENADLHSKVVKLRLTLDMIARMTLEKAHGVRDQLDEEVGS